MTVSISQVAVGSPGPRCVRFEGPAVGAGGVVGTFVVPAGVSVLFVTGVAAGAGGGGGASPSGPGGGGGGSGSFAVRWPIFVQSGEVLTITLPPPSAGGAAGAASAGAGSVTITSSLGSATRIAPRLATNAFALAGGGAAGAGSGTTGGAGGSSGILTGNTAGVAGGAGNQGALIDISGGMYHGRHVSGHSGGAATFGCPALNQSVHPGYVGPSSGDATNGGGGHGAWTPFGRGGVAGNGGSAGSAPAYGYGAGGGGGGGSAAGGAGGRAFLEIAW